MSEREYPKNPHHMACRGAATMMRAIHEKYRLSVPAGKKRRGK
jgi:hypothetical protein